MAVIEVVQGDITAQPDMEVIVNAANDELLPGSGVCGAIHRAAGPSLADECAVFGGCPTGQAVTTDAGNLPQCWVIHAVGPIWHGGNYGERELLASALVRSLEEAGRVGARSIAIPALSCGVYSFPPDEAAEILLSATRQRLAVGDLPLERVRFVLFGDYIYSVFQRALADASGVDQ